MEQNPMYKALLKWSLSQSDGFAPSSGEVKEMDKEKREFLERVMREMVEDESSTMMELVAKSKGPEGTDEAVAAKEDALEELCDRVDRIDYAITLHVYAGGFLPTFDTIKETAHDGIRQRAAELAACCMRNNPQCQQWALEVGAVETLSKVHSDPDHGEMSRVKALGALSALVQNFPPAEAQFLAGGGLRTMKADVEGIGRRLKVKALFMLQWLLAASADARKDAMECGMGDALAACCVDDDEEVVEFSAMALTGLLKEGTRVVQSAEKLVGKLEQRLNTGSVGSGEADGAAHNLKECISLLKSSPVTAAPAASEAPPVVLAIGN
mmetsp:Transcript_60693/g.149224  ORF Transcript_60693/g.149224 Transcript_60693/m.149224 type:complete len:325 (-) Transcript_60693:214-1188(-)|eukprot:CAMPEP_0206253138 /NCGR_PEP_ID=MMETSP0047_2-20121206/22992_1 /ASSEMBLY_ACC=CAM_ASM_000192 /TAXON_ID=195065 /ORGANISM="Chroomonas mesostigmatica_cf, Strain CCMP1168" /LENGTH=324 /DNA_ID=CAMNT_0053679327 /DNA_START=140 /DNA_END=1114 /DNA_ORIENTATION=-